VSLPVHEPKEHGGPGRVGDRPGRGGQVVVGGGHGPSVRQEQFRLRTTTEETRLSRSKPDRGLVRTKAELVNSGDIVPATLVAVNFIARRPS